MAFQMPAILVPTKCDVEPRNAVRSGGRSILGNEQRVMGDAGFLVVRYEIPVFTPEKVRAFRSMIARLRQGEEIVAKVWDRNHPIGAPNRSQSSVAKFVGSHALRATIVTMSVTGMVIDAGTLLGVGSATHIVTEVISGGATSAFGNPLWNGETWDDDQPWSDADPAARNVLVRIFPPLRTAAPDGGDIALGEQINFRGVLAVLSEGDMSLDNHGRNGSATLTIQESF